MRSSSTTMLRSRYLSPPARPRTWSSTSHGSSPLGRTPTIRHTKEDSLKTAVSRATSSSSGSSATRPSFARLASWCRQPPPRDSHELASRPIGAIPGSTAVGLTLTDTVPSPAAPQSTPAGLRSTDEAGAFRTLEHQTASQRRICLPLHSLPVGGAAQPPRVDIRPCLNNNARHRSGGGLLRAGLGWVPQAPDGTRSLRLILFGR